MLNDLGTAELVTCNFGAVPRFKSGGITSSNFLNADVVAKQSVAVDKHQLALFIRESKADPTKFGLSVSEYRKLLLREPEIQKISEDEPQVGPDANGVLLAALKDVANDHCVDANIHFAPGVFYPFSTKRLAHGFDVVPRTIVNRIRLLASEGFIVYRQRRSQSSVFQFTTQGLARLTAYKAEAAC